MSNKMGVTILVDYLFYTQNRFVNFKSTFDDDIYISVSWYHDIFIPDVN